MGCQSPVEIAREVVKEFYDADPAMPLMVRYCFHDAATYDRRDNTGGANGSIQFLFELDAMPNTGLRKAQTKIETIMAQIIARGVVLSYGDLIHLVGVMAIEVTGGPRIRIRMGRSDSKDKDDNAMNLPGVDLPVQGLRALFVTRMGMTDRELVLLSAAHTLGRCHAENGSGFDGPWTENPLVFDNEYLVNILKNASQGVLRTGMVQMTADLSLLDSNPTKAFTELYANDNDLFCNDYGKAHKWMTELGVTWDQMPCAPAPRGSPPVAISV